jgi:hypothetical protein
VLMRLDCDINIQSISFDVLTQILFCRLELFIHRFTNILLSFIPRVLLTQHDENTLRYIFLMTQSCAAESFSNVFLLKDQLNISLKKPCNLMFY